MTAAITVSNLGKRFRRRGADSPATLKEAIFRLGRGLKAETFWGLRDVSFSIAQGRTVGIIGRNGAGKSTMLRLVGGVGRPDTGKVQLNGRIGALLDLGSGLHPDLTGRENVFVAGIVSGMTRAEVARRFDDIVAFSELERFIDSPLRTYSSGMQMRLAFAVAVHIDPQVLLIDEVLAVGDLAFQRKCLDRIQQFKQQGCTIMIVSHDPGQISSLCDEVIWLRDGSVAAHGPTAQVLEEYVAFMEGPASAYTPEEIPTVTLPDGTELRVNENRFGSQEAQLTAVRLRDAIGETTRSIKTGDELTVELRYVAAHAIPGAKVSVSIHAHEKDPCLDTNLDVTELGLPELSGEGVLTLRIERLDLAPGDYFVNVGLYTADWARTCDYHWGVYPLQVVGAKTGQGAIQPPMRWSRAETPAVRPELVAVQRSSR